MINLTDGMQVAAVASLACQVASRWMRAAARHIKTLTDPAYVVNPVELVEAALKATSDCFDPSCPKFCMEQSRRLGAGTQTKPQLLDVDATSVGRITVSNGKPSMKTPALEIRSETEQHAMSRSPSNVPAIDGGVEGHVGETLGPSHVHQCHGQPSSKQADQGSKGMPALDALGTAQALPGLAHINDDPRRPHFERSNIPQVQTAPPAAKACPKQPRGPAQSSSLAATLEASASDDAQVAPLEVEGTTMLQHASQLVADEGLVNTAKESAEMLDSPAIEATAPASLCKDGNAATVCALASTASRKPEEEHGTEAELQRDAVDLEACVTSVLCPEVEQKTAETAPPPVSSVSVVSIGHVVPQDDTKAVPSTAGHGSVSSGKPGAASAALLPPDKRPCPPSSQEEVANSSTPSARPQKSGKRSKGSGQGSAVKEEAATPAPFTMQPIVRTTRARAAANEKPGSASPKRRPSAQPQHEPAPKRRPARAKQAETIDPPSPAVPAEPHLVQALERLAPCPARAMDMPASDLEVPAEPLMVEHKQALPEIGLSAEFPTQAGQPLSEPKACKDSQEQHISLASPGPAKADSNMLGDADWGRGRSSSSKSGKVPTCKGPSTAQHKAAIQSTASALGGNPEKDWLQSVDEAPKKAEKLCSKCMLLGQSQC